MNVHLTVYCSVPTLCIKSQGRDFPPVHGEVMYDIELTCECCDFAELCTDQIAHPPIQVASNACYIVHGPLFWKLDAARSTTFHVSEPERASMNIDGGEQVFPQLGRVCKNSDNRGDRTTPGVPARAISYSGRDLLSKKISLPPSVRDEIPSAFSS